MPIYGTAQASSAVIIAALGLGTDPPVQPGVLGSVQAHIRDAQEDIDNVETQIGLGTDAVVAAGVLGSVQGHIRDVQTQIGLGTDAAVQPGVLGTLQAHIREAQESIDTLATSLAALTAAGQQIFRAHITSNANAGFVTIATVTTQPVVIDWLVMRVNAALPASTVAPVYGGTAQAVTFLEPADAIAANLNAADKQLSWLSYGGRVELPATKVIEINLTGGGAVATDIQITIGYHAAISGGTLA